MIFVTVGTNEAPFDRLLRAVERLPTTEGIVVQHGASSVRPAGARCFESLPFEELVDYVRRARTVITHAGVGSIVVALQQGKRPVVVPRLRRFGEAVDDHQLGFTRRLEQAGLVTLVENPSQLVDALGPGAEIGAARLGADLALADDLRGYLHALVGEPPRAAA